MNIGICMIFMMIISKFLNCLKLIKEEIRIAGIRFSIRSRWRGWCRRGRIQEIHILKPKIQLIPIKMTIK